MNTTMKLFGLLLAMGLLIASCEEKETTKTDTDKSQVTPASADGTQTICPIMGNKITQECFVDYNGKRIYFCCPGCDKTFKEEPEKYIRQMESKGIVLAKIPTTTQ